MKKKMGKKKAGCAWGCGGCGWWWWVDGRRPDKYPALSFVTKEIKVKQCLCAHDRLRWSEAAHNSQLSNSNRIACRARSDGAIVLSLIKAQCRDVTGRTCGLS